MHKTQKNGSTNFRLVVDTNCYAGNFERKSIAYATGLVGECGVGQTEAEQAREELPEAILQFWEDHGQSLPDEHGCHRPATIYPTPGFFNHGHGHSFPLTDEGRAEGLIDYRKRVEEWVDKDRRQLQSIEVGLGKNGWTQKDLDEHKQGLEKKLEDAMNLTAVREHPSYQSAAVVCNKRPNADVLASFTARMQDYLCNRGVEILDIVVETEVIHIETKRESVIKAAARKNTPK